MLCTPNQQRQRPTVVPFQSPSIYNRKALQPLTAVSDDSLHKLDSGHFSDMEVPDQMCLITEDPEKYRKVVRMIRSVSQNKVWLRPLWLRVLIYITDIIFLFVCFVVFCTYLTATYGPTGVWVLNIFGFYSVPFGLIIQISLWQKDDEK